MSDFLDNLNTQNNKHSISKLNKKIKIIVADDNQDVHKITNLILKDFSYNEYTLEIYHAYSGSEVKSIMNKEENIAIILLDVVMEKDDSGLEVVKYIREELKNILVRIILRTGQPGKAPEDDIIKNYDINNYIEKTEGSVQKIYTALYSAIRSYTDLLKLYYSKKGLEKVVESSKELYKYDSLIKFYQGILIQLTHLLDFEENSFIASKNHSSSGSIISTNSYNPVILAGTGAFKKHINQDIKKVFRPEIIQKIKNQPSGKIVFYDTFYIGSWHPIEKEFTNYIYFETNKTLDSTDKKLIHLTINNFSLVINNFILNKKVTESQKDLIFKLGDVIETRLRDNHNHIYRVSEISVVLGKASGLNDKELELLRITSPLHDIGKISIMDDILLKPGKLTDDEFDLIKKHPKFGYDMLHSKTIKGNDIFDIAADIAHHHHEKWNGCGYPTGLREEEISIFARIVSVADVFDALSHERSYKKAWPMEKIKELMIDEKGKSFEPKLVDILLNNIEKIKEILEEYPA
jgi:response regulator RpfG family c-di-GMP phosphodiesterase